MKRKSLDEMIFLISVFEESLEGMIDLKQHLNTQVDRLHKDMHQLEVENGILRILCMEMYEDVCMDEDKWRYRDRMQDLGMDV